MHSSIPSVTRNVQRFRGELVFKAHRLCVSLNSRLESNKEEKKKIPTENSSGFSCPTLNVGGVERLGFQVESGG